MGSLTSLKPTQIAGRAREKMAHSMGLLFITESIAKVLVAKKGITSEDLQPVNLIVYIKVKKQGKELGSKGMMLVSRPSDKY